MDKRVLVVEDDIEINELLGEYLTLEGLGSVSALDGRTALDLANASHPDAAILDLMLPDIDGYEVCRQLAAHRATAGIPVVMLTCMNQQCDKMKGLESGAFRFMNKPFLPDDLIVQIKAAFEWKKVVATRPPLGQFEISQARPEAGLHGINEMIIDIFNHSDLPDASVAGIREGFRLFYEWALQWGTQQKRDPRLMVQYRLSLATGQLAASERAQSAEWVISESEPGLLADVLFKHLPPVAVLSSNRVNGALEAAKSSPLSSWYQFLAKSGATKFDKDVTLGQVRLQRLLTGNGDDPMAVPAVTIDGSRIPTRLRAEALASKQK